MGKIINYQHLHLILGKNITNIYKKLGCFFSCYHDGNIENKISIEKQSSFYRLLSFYCSKTEKQWDIFYSIVFQAYQIQS